MSKCRNCKIEILDETEVCPLCRSVLEQTEELENMYPNARLRTQKLMFACRLYLFCAIVAVFVLVGIDFRTESEITWSLFIGLVLFYAYTVFRYAVIGKMGYRGKVLLISVITILIAVGIDFATGYRGWSVDYVISSGILVVDIGIIVLMICNRRNWQSYITWQILMILCSIVPLCLWLFGIENNAHMAVLPLVISVFLFLGTLMIGGRRAILELKRRFHM